MAIEKKRMQQRGGPYNQFDKSKTLPKEFQFVNSGDPNTSDGRAIYATFESGDPKRLSTYEDMSNDLALALAGLEEEYLGSITQATQNAISATSQASSAATAANQAADEANEIIDAFREAVDGTVISDSSPSSSTAYSSKKIENDFLKKSGDGSNVTATFQQAADRAGIQSGDSLAVAFGKLAKFCADIQDYVFSPPVASLASTDAARPLAASMGKRLNDDFTAKYNALHKIVLGYIETTSPSVSLKTFCDKIIELSGGLYTAIPFKFRAAQDWSPTAQTNWVKGVVHIQNANYDYSEIGTMYLVVGADLYIGYIKQSNSVPSVEWKKAT